MADSTPSASRAGAPTEPVIDGFLELRGITKAFGDDAVVEDVSMSVARGDVVSIIGPSGAGKSTLLRCINFLEPPDRGQIYLDGQQVCPEYPRRSPSAKSLTDLRRRVGMVFQRFELFPHLTALRNVALAQERVLGRSRADAERRALELLGQVGLAEKAASYPRQCSGGQQQRVAIARALALEPKVMLFDEPTSALDPELGMEVLRVMQELATGGMTMLVVTHEMHFATDVSDRIVVMAEGRIIEDGPPEQVTGNPTHERTRRFLQAVLER